MTKDIVLICDDNYCLPTAVCIKSFIDNYNSSNRINIHVCTFGLNDDNVNKLKRMGNNNVKVSIELFRESNFASQLKVVSQKSHVTPTALIKFELPNYFSSLDTLLYIDSDIVIKSDISELLNIDIRDYYLAASYEFFEYLKTIQFSLKRTPSENFYFNSGVMLLNLRMMRENNITDKLWDYKLNKTKTKLMDQESLNAICSSNALHLPIKWNFNPYFNKPQYIKYINRVYGSDYQSVLDLENDIKVIHYVGARDKPWVYSNARMRSYWKQSFEKTPFLTELNLNDYQIIKRTPLQAFIERIKDYGLWGTICFFIYRIETKVK